MSFGSSVIQTFESWMSICANRNEVNDCFDICGIKNVKLIIVLCLVIAILTTKIITLSCSVFRLALCVFKAIVIVILKMHSFLCLA